MKNIERAGYGNIIKKKNVLIPRIVIVTMLLFTACILSFGIFKLIRYRESQKNISVERLYTLWDESNYEQIYAQTGLMLEKNPSMNVALAFRGYSAFYLAVAQVDTVAAQNYIDDAINSLRLALQNSTSKTNAQIEYMLAKSYFYKNTFSLYYYYSDLVIKYFNLAKLHGYVANDIPEYLGLSYAALGMSEKSIEAFTEALFVRQSDTLLYAIGEQYYKTENMAMAKQYLFRIISDSFDELLVLKSRNLLGIIYSGEGNIQEAKKEFQLILEKDANFADAYYELGVIYEKEGNLIKARAEWRKALKAQVNHPGAQLKLNNS